MQAELSQSISCAGLWLRELRHRCEVFERAELLSQLLAQADHIVGRPHVIDLRALGFLGFVKLVRAAECNAAMVADNAAAAVGIGQTGNDPGLPTTRNSRACKRRIRSQLCELRYFVNASWTYGTGVKARGLRRTTSSSS